MREIDFVPTWYAATYRRRRLLKLQLYCTVLVVLSLTTWSIVKAQQLDDSQHKLKALVADLERSEQRVRERQVQEQLRQQLQTQDKVDTSLGLNVEASRVIELVDRCVPREASLISLDIDTDERVPSLAQRAAVAGKPGAKSGPQRTLSVSIKGVAPTNGDVATLLENLTDTGFCRDVRLDYARARLDGDHTMQEFAVLFSIGLSATGGAE